MASIESVDPHTDRRPPEGHYDFGSNWRTFVEGHLDEERLEQARKSLTEFLSLENLRGKSFLDIGCGSGLFSLAAHTLGAERILSFDVNPNSVDCCKSLWEAAGTPEGWVIRDGSVLDPAFMGSVGEFDVVYSWGVLHHTGDMWSAIAAAARQVVPGGQLYIAIYNKADGFGIYSDGRVGSSRFWEGEKKLYVSLPDWGKRVVDYTAAGGMIAVSLLRLQNPVKMIRDHKQLRGMSWMVDIRDWLGGWPYEYASVDEIFEFMHGRHGFQLENMTSTNSLVNNEFLFRRPAASASS